MEMMRLDRRLIGRRNWISKDELEKELESLPDASHKVDAGGESEAPASAEGPTSEDAPTG